MPIFFFFFFFGQDNLLGGQFWAMGRFNLLGGQSDLLSGQPGWANAHPVIYLLGLLSNSDQLVDQNRRVSLQRVLIRKGACGAECSIHPRSCPTIKMPVICVAQKYA